MSRLGAPHTGEYHSALKREAHCHPHSMAGPWAQHTVCEKPDTKDHVVRDLGALSSMEVSGTESRSAEARG